MKRSIAWCAAFAIPVASYAAQVWQSTFDSGPDGVVDIFNNDTGKVMIGPNSGGRQQITSWDNSISAFTPDKAGRPLGSTQDGSNSFSGLYEFNWSQLNTDEAQAYEAVGFLGNSSPQTRQIMGAILRHWKVTGTSDNYIGLDVGYGSDGSSGHFGYLGGPSVYIGSNPTANDYKLAIGYDGSSKVLTLGLYDALGTLVTSNSANLATLTSPGEVAVTALTHLGWSDYTGNGGDRASVWQVNTLTYFNTADGAALAAVAPEPATAMLLLIGASAVSLRPRRRMA